MSLLSRIPDSAGLEIYLAELASGVSKSRILERIRNSPEGSRNPSSTSRFRNAWLKLTVMAKSGPAGM
ncbi:MAG: DUF4214 domain-containing protein [Steroidobacterales bacterium]